MNILLTNDDGYTSDGLITLKEKLIQKTSHNVYVCAPLSQKKFSWTWCIII